MKEQLHPARRTFDIHQFVPLQLMHSLLYSVPSASGLLLKQMPELVAVKLNTVNSRPNLDYGRHRHIQIDERIIHLSMLSMYFWSAHSDPQWTVEFFIRNTWPH